jgi:uncharacterized Zn finger protein
LVVEALKKAGRQSEITSVLEKVAPITYSYLRLIKHLTEQGNFEQANRYIETAVNDSRNEEADKYRHLNSDLLILRTNILEKTKQLRPLLTYQICEFVKKPSVASFGKIKTLAGKLRCWPDVRPSLINFLNTGVFPWDQPAFDFANPDKLELTRGFEKVSRLTEKCYPRLKNLLEIAISENDTGETLRLYADFDKIKKSFNSWEGNLDSLESMVANTIKDHDPQMALKIWKRLAEDEIARAKPRQYDAVMTYLGLLKGLMLSLNQKKEWKIYLTELCTVNKKRRLLLPLLLDLL